MKVYKHVVQYYETDRMGIVHHSNYVRWMEEARMDFLAQIGWNYAEMEANGYISPVVSVAVEYRRTSTFPQVIAIEVGVEDCSAARFKLYYTMRNPSEEIVCEAHSEHCFLNKEGKPVALKRYMPGFYEVLRANKRVTDA